jgi:hypothetical protein
MSRLLRPSLSHLAARSLQSRAASSSASGTAAAGEAASSRFDGAAPAPSSSTSAWAPALPRGTEPAYDEALEFLAAHRKKLAGRVEELRQQAAGVTDAEEQKRLAAVIRSAEVARDVNDPETRMRFQTQEGEWRVDWLRPMPRLTVRPSCEQCRSPSPCSCICTRSSGSLAPCRACSSALATCL